MSYHSRIGTIEFTPEGTTPEILKEVCFGLKMHWSPTAKTWTPPAFMVLGPVDGLILFFGTILNAGLLEWTQEEFDAELKNMMEQQQTGTGLANPQEIQMIKQICEYLYQSEDLRFLLTHPYGI